MPGNLKILFFGDVVGRLGRMAVAKVLPQWKKKYRPDLVIANAENLAHGAGVTPSTLEELLASGVDFCTSGNHIFDRPEVLKVFEQTEAPLLRPANYPPGTPGKGHRLINVGKNKILVINLLGRIFMREELDCPFRAVNGILEHYRDEKLQALIVDFHAEATSEKVAMGWHLDGRASLVVGTHSHVPTADARLLPQGTAVITDIGMTGGRDTVIGVDKDKVLERFLAQLPNTFEWPDRGPVSVNAVITEIDYKTARSKKIKLLQTEVII